MKGPVSRKTTPRARACLAQAQRIDVDHRGYVQRDIQLHGAPGAAAGRHALREARPQVRRRRGHAQPTLAECLGVDEIIRDADHELDAASESAQLDGRGGSVERSGRELGDGAEHRVERIAELREIAFLFDSLVVKPKPHAIQIDAHTNPIASLNPDQDVSHKSTALYCRNGADRANKYINANTKYACDTGQTRNKRSTRRRKRHLMTNVGDARFVVVEGRLGRNRIRARVSCSFCCDSCKLFYHTALQGTEPTADTRTPDLRAASCASAN